MAARRLVIVMIVLLVISTVVAIIAPPAAERERRDAAPTTATTPDDPGWHKENERRRLHSVVDSSSVKAKRIDAYVGDVLRLEIGGGQAREINLPELGLFGTQSRSAPATFEIYFDSPGTFRALDAKSDTLLAKIVVSEPDRDSPEGRESPVIDPSPPQPAS